MGALFGMMIMGFFANAIFGGGSSKKSSGSWWDSLSDEQKSVIHNHDNGR